MSAHQTSLKQSPKLLQELPSKPVAYAAVGSLVVAILMCLLGANGMRNLLLVLAAVIIGNANAAECALSLKNGINLESTKTEIFRILGAPKETYSEKEGAFDNGISYEGLAVDFMGESIMAINITDRKYPLQNGMQVGNIENTKKLVLDVFPEPKEGSDCWCRFEITSKIISRIQLLCPL